MATRTPQSRSTELLQAEGYLVEVVEQVIRIPGGRTWRRDLWGIVDLLCIRRDEVLAVQVTSASNVSARIAKITASEHLPRIREALIRLEVHGWRKNSRGQWILRREDLS